MPRRGWSESHYLFHDYDLHAGLQGQIEKLKQTIDAADPASIADDLDEVVERFVPDFHVDTPELIEGAVSVDVEEAKVDASGDPRRIFRPDRSGPFYVPGIR